MSDLKPRTHPAIRTLHLTRTFESRRAVDGLTIEVPAGSIFGFLGPNGAGKTTTIRMLLGLLRPTSGSASVLGYDVARQGGDIRRAVGALLENPGIYDRLTVEENLEVIGRIWGLPAGERRARNRRLLDRFRLRDRARDPAGELSRGMKQKLAIARALLPEPQLLFLDEPTANLDPEAALSLRHDLMELAEERGITIFLTTHNLAEAERACSLIGLIREGRLLGVGAPEDLRLAGRPRVRLTGRSFTEPVLTSLRSIAEVGIVSSSGESLMVEVAEASQIPVVVRTVVEAGGEVEHVSEQVRSLEDIYVETMRGARER